MAPHLRSPDATTIAETRITFVCLCVCVCVPEMGLPEMSTATRRVDAMAIRDTTGQPAFRRHVLYNSTALPDFSRDSVFFSVAEVRRVERPVAKAGRAGDREKKRKKRKRSINVSTEIASH